LGLGVSTILLRIRSCSAWSWLGVGESEGECGFRYRAWRRPGMRPWIWGIGKWPGVGVAVGQSNVDVGSVEVGSVRVAGTILVMKRMLVPRLGAGSVGVEVLVT
jgi:hypothetical protein